jgi:hypothetical protein
MRVLGRGGITAEPTSVGRPDWLGDRFGGRCEGSLGLAEAGLEVARGRAEAATVATRDVLGRGGGSESGGGVLAFLHSRWPEPRAARGT